MTTERRKDMWLRSIAVPVVLSIVSAMSGVYVTVKVLTNEVAHIKSDVSEIKQIMSIVADQSKQLAAHEHQIIYIDKRLDRVETKLESMD